MALIDEGSVKVGSTDLDIFSVPPTDKSFKEQDFSDFRPIESVSTGGTIRFVIVGNAEEYLKFSHTYLKFGVYVRHLPNKVVGDPVVDDKFNLWPVNNFGNSICKTVEVKLGTQNVTTQ